MKGEGVHRWTLLVPLLLALTAALWLTSRLTLAEASGTHEVQPGETLWAIAQRYGTTVEALVTLNNLADPDLIVAGQRLRLPPEAGLSGPATPEAIPGEFSPLRPAVSAPRPASDPGPGSILARRRLVTYYGNPWTCVMGILGCLDKATLVRELRDLAARYERAGGKPVQPAVHLVVTVAQAGPGPDGLFRQRMPASMIEEYSQLAAANGLLLILDVQVGRSTVAAELAPLVRYLERPHVHLALDPEFSMGPDERPGVHLGSMDARAINYAQDLLAGIVARQGGANKILIVHQFDASMITNKQLIRNDPRVDVVIDMDGFGGREIKIKHYNMYVRDELIEFGGIKLFYKQDTNLLQPEEVLRLTPPPDVIIYQ